MICPKCNGEIREGARFCAQCGNPVVPAENSGRRTLVHNILLMMILVLLLILWVKSVSGGFRAKRSPAVGVLQMEGDR